MACDVQCICYSVSTLESDSDDSGKGVFSMQDESPITTVKEEEILTGDSGESAAGEDDFNPFGNSGSEDEGNMLSTLYLKGHSQLVHMRIRYHFIANLHITLHLKKRA